MSHNKEITDLIKQCVEYRHKNKGGDTTFSFAEDHRNSFNAASLIVSQADALGIISADTLERDGNFKLAFKEISTQIENGAHLDRLQHRSAEERCAGLTYQYDCVVRGVLNRLVLKRRENMEPKHNTYILP